MPKPFNTLVPHILFQEVPDEISLGFTVMGCPLKCQGCHSEHTWDPGRGTPLTPKLFRDFLDQYQGLITCVLFFGGEWQLQALLPKLKLARQSGLKTCLYTGREHVPDTLKKELTYLKTGRWVEAMGGLDRPTTNQRFIDLSSGNLLNHKFQENSHHVDA